MALPVTYEDLIDAPASEKIILAWIEPNQRAVTWTLDSGAIFKRISSFYVVDTLIDTTSLTEATSKVLSPGEWFFDRENGETFIRLSDDSNPQDSFIILTLRLFFSDGPFIATHDLTDTGFDVEYQGLIKNDPNFDKEIDPATQLGISLESDGTLELENSHGVFDPIIDKFFWENRRVVIYSWFPQLPISERKKLFEGKIEDKGFSPNSISFKIKDQIFSLRKEIKANNFTLADGKISDDVLGTPKRRLYGQVTGVLIQSIDQVLDGFNLTGTVSTNFDENATVTGVGTLFTSELAVGNTINVGAIDYLVVSIASNLSMVIKGITPIIDVAINSSYSKITIFNLTGVLSHPVSPLTRITGSGTKFTSELSGGDTILVNNLELTVDIVIDDVTLDVNEDIAFIFSNLAGQRKDSTTLTGTVSFDDVGNNLVGVGTTFLSEVTPDDLLSVQLNVDLLELSVRKVISDTILKITGSNTNKFTAKTLSNNPEIPFRGKNRTHHLADHKLREPSTTITEVIQQNRIRVGNVSDFFALDNIKVNGTPRIIKRITDDVLVLTQSLSSPSIGQTVTKNPVNKVTFNKLPLVIDRDFTVTNTTEAKIVFNDLAEFNQTQVKEVLGVITFTNGSRNITGTGSNFLTEFKPRDWIISRDVTHQVFYEILQINSNNGLDIRIAYAGNTFIGGARKKNVIIIDDDSAVIVDCVGKEDASGNWIKTASDVVKDLVVNDGNLTNINTTAFNQAVQDAPFIVALKLPLDKGKSKPIIRDVINLVNKSVFGSLISNSDFSIAYNILNAEKPIELIELKDDDIVGDPIFKGKTKIRRFAFGKFNHFDADIFTLEEGNSNTEFDNTFVENLIGNEDSLNVDIYLFNKNDADTITQRYGLFNSLAQSQIQVKAKMNLTLKNLGDKIFISLDRLFFRFGATSARKKIAVITKIVKSGSKTDVVISDLASIFNRVGTIADDASLDFTIADDTEKIRNGYIVDNSTELPDSAATTDDEWGSNIIG